MLLLFRMKTGKDGDEKEYGFFQHIDVTKSANCVAEALGGVCLKWSTDDDVDYRIKEHNVNISGRKSIEAEEWIAIENFHTLIRFVFVFRTNHANAPFLKAVLWPLRRFYMKRFYINI